MSKEQNCMFCELNDENEMLLNEYNLLKLKYDRYDLICLDFLGLGFVVGVLVSIIIFVISSKGGY